jgi:hypothetical protein
MVGQTAITFVALAALAQSKAIITNNCEKDVYVWSIPNNGAYAYNQAIKPAGGQYIETFHQGTAVNPGIAIKVSSELNGIRNGKGEIDFAYSVDKHDNSKVWINLSMLRDDPFRGDIALHTCNGPYKGPIVPTRQCNIDDDIELVLCGTQRTSPEEDPTPREILARCARSLSDQGGGANNTNSRRVRSCQGHVVAPSEAAPQRGSVKHDKDEAKTAVRKKQDKQTPHPNQPKQGCKCEWVTEGFKCNCKNFVKKPSSKYHCMETGDFQYCFDGKTAEKATSPDSFADLYAKPFLRLIFADACDIATENNWNCSEFKASIKAVYPDIDKPANQLQARNATVKFPVQHLEKGQQSKRDFVEACSDLIKLFGNEFKMTDCNVLINEMKVRYKNKTVKLGKAKDKYMPDADSSDIESALSGQWPEVDWTTDDE